MDMPQQPATTRPALSDQDKADLEDILNNKTFYYELGTLLCNGQLGPQSQYMRTLSAPPRSMGTRSMPGGASAAPRTVNVPHAVRAYEAYAGSSGFQPFKNQ
ncbi:hypothetical protein BGX34_008635, partial [Mortierella sp. NVP85]